MTEHVTTPRTTAGAGDAAPRRSTFAAVLLLLLATLTVPVIVSGRGGTAEAFDQQRYHEPVIRAMAAQWPRVDLRDYNAATTPGYHLLMATAARYVTGNTIALQLISSVLTITLILVFYRQMTAALPPAAAAAVVLPFLGSSYVLGAAIWLVTDNAALLFVVLTLGACVGAAWTTGRVVRGGVYAAIAVFVRQIHLWLAAPVALAAGAIGLGLAHRSATRKAPLAMIAASLLPFAVLAPFVILWDGLTPPMLADRHDAGVNPAVGPISMALFGAFGVFFLPAFVDSRRHLLPRGARGWIVVAVVMLLAAAPPSSYDKTAGRWGGAIWELVRLFPTIADRSVVLPLLSGLGALVAVHAGRAAVAAGNGRRALILLVSMIGWMAAQAVSSIVFQKYCEPIVLLALAWLVVLGRPGREPGASAKPESGSDRWWWGILGLGLIQIGLCGYTLYWPVWNAAP
jgi:hypothetical protein